MTNGKKIGGGGAIRLETAYSKNLDAGCLIFRDGSEKDADIAQRYVPASGDVQRLQVL